MKRKRSWRRRLAWTVFLAAATLVGLYAYATRPDALRAKLFNAAREYGFEIRALGGVSFSPFDGLLISDLSLDRVTAPDTPAPSGPDRVRSRLHIPTTRIGLRLLPLLRGRIRADHVDIEDPQWSIEVTEFSGPRRRMPAYDASAIFAPHFCGTPHWPDAVRIHAADIQLFARSDQSPRRLLRRWVIDVAGQTTTYDKASGFALRVTQRAGPAQRSAADALAEFGCDQAGIHAQIDWVDWPIIEALLPAQARAALAAWRPAGRVSLPSASIDEHGWRELQLHFDQLDLDVPVEEFDDADGHERYARVLGAAGTLTLVRQAASATPGRDATPTYDLDLQLAGALRDAPITLETHIDGLRVAPAPNPRVKPTDPHAADRFLFDGYRAEFHAESLDLPNADDHPAFVTSTWFTPRVRRLIDEYDARGRVDLHVSLAREPNSPSPSAHYEGRLEARGASCRHFHFPYRLNDIHGTVRFSNDGFVLEDLRGTRDSGTIWGDGVINNIHPWTGFDLRFRARNVALDRSLYEALPPEYQTMWDGADLVGLCDLQARVHRDEGDADNGARHTGTDVDARLLSGSIRLPDQRTLDHIDGEIHVRDGKLRIADLHGYLDGASVRLNGRMQNRPDTPGTEHVLHIEAFDAPLAHVSRISVAPTAPREDIRFSGRGDVWGQERSGATSEAFYALHVTDGKLTGFDSQRAWSNLNAWMTTDEDTLRILSLRAGGDRDWLSISGQTPRHADSETPIALEISAGAARLEGLLRRIVPAHWRRLRDTIGLRGAGQLTACVQPAPANGASTGPTVSIQLHADEMRPEQLPVMLRDVDAEVTIRPDGFTLHRSATTYGNQGRIEMHGEGGWDDADAWTELRLTADTLDLATEVGPALPKALRRLLAQLSPTGSANIRLDRLRLNSMQNRDWTVVGEAAVENATLSIGLPLKIEQGELRGEARYAAGGPMTFDGEFEIERGVLDGRPLSQCSGRLIRSASGPQVSIEDVRGDFCDGEIAGRAVVNPDRKTYELSCTLHGVDLQAFMTRAGDTPASSRHGEVDGFVFVRGSLENPTQRTGGGQFQIRSASLLSSRVTASVVEASRRQKRPLDEFAERAELEFVWQGDTLQFSRVDVQTRTRRLVGAGSWNRRTDAIELTLLAALPEDAPRLLLLTDLLERAGKELVQYRVTGTASNPRVAVEPLHNLTEPLRQMLQGLNRSNR